MARVAFIGLGNMGLPMARNLIEKGHQLQIFDLVFESMQKLESLGASAMDTAHQAVADVDYVISMLPGDRQVEQLYLKDDLLSAISPDSLIIDCSTIASYVAARVADTAQAQQRQFIDAPVSGGVTGAEAGILTFMVGGADLQFECAHALLADMGKNIFHAGQRVGDGQVAKICNNLLLSSLMVASCEALQLGADNGLDISKLTEIFKQSSGDNWVLHKYHPWPGVMEAMPASHNYQPGFMVQLMLKDLGLALDTALKSGTPTPMGALTRSLYSMHEREGWGRRDFSSILQRFVEKD